MSLHNEVTVGGEVQVVADVEVDSVVLLSRHNMLGNPVVTSTVISTPRHLVLLPSIIVFAKMPRKDLVNWIWLAHNPKLSLSL